MRSRLRTPHAVMGIVPLTTYLVWHLLTYAHALSGEASLARAVSRVSRWLWLPTIVVVAALGLHAGYGFKLTADRWKAGRAKAVQRAAGVVLLAFLVHHFFDLALPLLTGRMIPEEIYPLLAYRFSSTVASIPVYALVYLVALLAAVMHVCIGLHELFVSVGFAVSARSQKVAVVLLATAGLTLFLLGSDIVIYFAAGERAIVPNKLVPARAHGAAACDLPPAAAPARK
jgi:succinate dehydrogenase/fumarate reductase cytochrome b subunit (b558 family)